MGSLFFPPPLVIQNGIVLDPWLIHESLGTHLLGDPAMVPPWSESAYTRGRNRSETRFESYWCRQTPCAWRPVESWLPPPGFPEDLVRICPNRAVLYRLAMGHGTLVQKISYYLQPGAPLRNVHEVSDALFHIRNALFTTFPTASVFAGFYGGRVTPRVAELVAKDHFSKTGFMKRQPAPFARLYLEALYLFLTDPMKLEQTRPAWFVTLRYALQGHRLPAIHACLGICAHIMADLAVGVCENLIDVYTELCIEADPSLAGKPRSFFVDRMLDPTNPFSVWFLAACRSDHDAIEDVIEFVTPDVVQQFVADWNDGWAEAFSEIERYTATTGKNGAVTRNIVLPKIAKERVTAFDDALRLAETERSCYTEAEKTLRRERLLLEIHSRALVMANKLAIFSH